MTLAPARLEHAPPDPGGAEPTVVAVLVTRRDPRGLHELLESVLTQSLTPDSVLVLDRTEGRVLPAPPSGDGSPVDDGVPPDASASPAEGAPRVDKATPVDEVISADDAPPTEEASPTEEAPPADGALLADEVRPTDEAMSADEVMSADDASPTDEVVPADGALPADATPADHHPVDRPPADRPPAPVADDVAAIVREVAPGHGIPVLIRPVDPRTPLRSAVHLALLALDGADASGTHDHPTSHGRDDDAHREDYDAHGADDDAHGGSGRRPALPPTLAWILPVGTTPEPGTLVALVDTWRRSPSTGVVGPKHVDAGDPNLLRALAIHTTRGGRLLDRPTPGTPDQGQYDRMTDALAVPLAGSLLERELVLTLGGWERSFGDVGADLDFGWRAQEVGRRVVVVPSARVVSEPGAAPATATTTARRRQGRRVALTRAAWWAAVPLAIWVAVTSLVTALALLLLKRPRAAWAELSSLAALDPFRGVVSRWRTRHRREVRRRDLRALFEPRRAVLSDWGDAVHDALVAPRPPMGDEEPDLNPRSWVAKVVRHPGVLAVLGAAVVAAVAGRSLGPSLVTGAGSGLAGGELVGSRADATTLWHSWADGWSGAGLGGPDPVGPHIPLLAGPTWVVDHLPLLPSPASPAGFVVALLVILGMPLAAASAYLAFRTMIASRRVRGVAAFAWATTGVAAASVAQGRLGALVALVVLPLLASGFWLLATRRSTATSAFATALAAVVLGAFVPVLMALGCVLAVVLALVRSRVRLHAVVVALVPLGLLAPWLLPAAEASWPSLVAGVGTAQWGGTTPDPWQLALLHPGGAGAPVVWAGLPLVAVAVLSLWRGRAWRNASTTLAVLAPILLALALVAPAVRVGTVPAGVEGAGEPITLWSGTMLLPLALVVVLALARGLDGIHLRRPADGTRTADAARWTAVVGGALAVAAGAVAVAWAGLGSELAPWRDPRPAVSVEQAEGAFATRALFVVPGDRGAGYRLVGREAADLVRALPTVADADGSLATRVSGVLADPSKAPALVADTATDLLAVRAGIVPEVTRRLDAAEGLQRIAPRDGWEMWRVSPSGSADGLVAPPRLRLDSPEGTLLVTTTGQHAATTTAVDVPAEGRLVVAEAPGWAERAVVALDGTVLEPLPDTSTPTYALPPGSGRLTITLTDPARWWHIGQLAAFGVLCFLAIPFGRRASRVGQG